MGEQRKSSVFTSQWLFLVVPILGLQDGSVDKDLSSLPGTHTMEKRELTTASHH